MICQQAAEHVAACQGADIGDVCKAQGGSCDTTAACADDLVCEAKKSLFDCKFGRFCRSGSCRP